MLDLIRAETLGALPGVAHGFTTRRGGRSTGPLAGLNLALRPGETPGNLCRSWALALGALGGAGTLDLADLALVTQVHGAAVLHATEGAGPLDTLGEADALVTCTPGLALAIRTADCVPILLASAGARPGVAAVHAGWRGTAARIVTAALEALLALTGAAPSSVRAAIGPAIGACCYEVGPEVAEALAAVDPGCLHPGPRGRPMADLQGANAALLRGAGLGAIATIPRCTACDPALFSHRGDGPATGRQAALIALLP